MVCEGILDGVLEKLLNWRWGAGSHWSSAPVTPPGLHDALLFIIFDVEVALFFPWATVFGKATQLADPTVVSVSADGQSLTPEVAGLFKELGLKKPVVPSFKPSPRQLADIDSNRGEKPARQAESEWAVQKSGRMLARTAFVDMSAFYVILLVGFAYVWYRGDLDWVRAVANQRADTSTGDM